MFVVALLALIAGNRCYSQEAGPAGSSETPAVAPAPIEDNSPSDAPIAPEKNTKASDEHHDHNPAANSDSHHGDDHHGDGHHGPKLGTILPKPSILPFALLLGAIAIFPLIAHHWWEHNSSKGMVAAILGIPTALYLASYGENGQHALHHAGMEYVSFLLLLGSLFVISGGIYIRGSFVGTPVVNVIFLGIGTLFASIIGTTGASMLLIRPLLRANAHRANVAHVVVFFIFTVSNCGGLLTPLGDPPLFLGFLKGVPFDWTLQLYPQWMVVNISLLALFFVYDSMIGNGNKAIEIPAEAKPNEPFGIDGVHNFIFLLGIVAIIYSSGQGIGNGGKPWPWGMQEAAMFAVGLAAFIMTPGAIRTRNSFSFAPINEVAILFAGIFVTMIPALEILNVEGKSLGLTERWHYFWATGILSSVLDNAPTYLTFAATACGVRDVPTDGTYLKNFLALGKEAEMILAAISCGAVLMGANTYIGNGPNFMVKAIAEENNVKMPSFFGYMVYSGCILIPIFVVMTFIFFV